MNINRLIKDINNINLAKNLDKDKLDKIGYDCYRGYKDDKSDPKRMAWEENINEYIDIAMQIIENKSDPWEGCANIKLPLLTEAAIQFNARAYPALVPSKNIVKCSTYGFDPNGMKIDRGERVGRHMSYQLQEEMDEWEDEMDKGLLILPILGCFFKKTFFNPELARNESKLVMPQNLIVQYDAPHIDRAPRQTEIIEFYPREIEEKKRVGLWLDEDIPYEDEENEKLEKFIIQHTTLDLKDIGYKIPYIITLHKRSKKVMRIVANYTENDIYFNDGTEIISVRASKNRIDDQNKKINQGNIDNLAIAQQLGEADTAIKIPEIEYPNYNKYSVVRIDSTKYYTKFGFLPSPDGGIYDIGLGQLLSPLTDAADTLVNQMLDAGSLANLQGGLMSKGIKTPAGTSRVNVNEWTKIETNGMSLRDAIMPFNFRGPNPTAYNLLAFLIDSAKAVANLKDILSGEAPMGETATTSMIKREEGMRIYNAIYKRVYRSFKKELRKLYDLNTLYLPQEVYFIYQDSQEAIRDVDYSFDRTDIVPTADPSESIQSQKIVKAEAALQFVGDPEMNSYEIKRRYLEAIEMPNIDIILPPPSNEPQPPDPRLIQLTAEIAETEARTKKLQLETAEVISKVIKNLADAESKEVGQQINMLKTQADLLIRQGVQGGMNEVEQRRDTAMAQRPADTSREGTIPAEIGRIERPEMPVS